MTELRRLLSFMSAWDREAALARYGAMLDDSVDSEALMEAMGTPTRLAIELARTYIPSPAPVEEPEPELAATDEFVPLAVGEPEPVIPEIDMPEQIQWELDPEPEAPAETPTKQVIKGGALAGYLVPAILIGLPVAILLICLGLPFILASGALVSIAVQEALKMIALLPLISDVLLTVGGALCACAVALLLFWLGIWLSMELCWLWVDKVLLNLGRKLCVEEVPVQ